MTDEGEYGFMYKSKEAIEWIRSLFDDPTKTLIFHKAKFDLKMFSFEGIDIFNSKAHVDCTLILAKLFNMSYFDYGLRALALKLLRLDTEDKDDIADWVKANKRQFEKDHGRPPGFQDAPEDFVRRRALWDVRATLMLHAFLKVRVMDICPNLYETERLLQYVVIDMENTGVRVDLTRAKQLRAEARRNVKILRRKLHKLTCPFTIKKVKCSECGRSLKSVLLKNDELFEHMFCAKCGELVSVVVEEHEFDEFNPGSKAIQVPHVFEQLGFELKYKTKPKKKKTAKGKIKTGGGRWAFDEYAMIRYVSKPLASIIRDSGEEGWPFDKWLKAVEDTIDKHDLPKRDWLPMLMMKVGELEKMISTYYDHIINQSIDIEVDPSGRETGILHCNFNQSEAMSGRFSSSEPNLQNIPRILGPRECFIPRKGRYNLHADYEQVEMKFFVHFAEDEGMAEAIKSDIHLYVAADIYNKPAELVTKEQRKRAKGVNFGIIYGSGPATMAETLTKKGLPTTKAEATIIVAAYHRKYPSVRRLTNKLKSELKMKEYVTTPFERRYYIPEKFSYTALNYLCQGTSADMMKAAMVKVWFWLRKHAPDCKMLMTVHDELVIECPKAKTEWVMRRVKPLMEDHENFFIPITVDFEVNDKRWSKKSKPSDLGLKLAA